VSYSTHLETIMARTVLLLIGPAPGDDWWRCPRRASLCRAVFDCWWQGATTAALLPMSASAEGMPVVVERWFAWRGSARIPLALRFWLIAQRATRIVVAGPGASVIAHELIRRGYVVDTLGQPVEAAGVWPIGGLPLRVA
jgi:hypothetical protein